AGLACAGVALEEDEPAHLHVAHERAELLVAVHLRAAKPHQEQITEGQRRRGLPGCAIRGRGGGAALDDQDEKESGEPWPHRRPAARTSARPRAASTPLGAPPARFRQGPT